MIKLEHVSKSYSAGIPALNDVSLEIEEGEFVFVMGDSGSGKSTLIKLLLKELEPTGGTIVINGQRLGKIRHKNIPRFRRNIGESVGQLRLQNVFQPAGLALRQTFPHAEDDAKPLLQCERRFFPHEDGRLAKDMPPLGVAGQNPGAAGVQQHAGRNFTSERA